jgi:hypothetical protein
MNTAVGVCTISRISNGRSNVHLQDGRFHNKNVKYCLGNPHPDITKCQYHNRHGVKMLLGLEMRETPLTPVCLKGPANIERLTQFFLIFITSIQ